MNDEFYVGYEPKMPPRLARHVRRVAWSAVGLALAVAAVLLLAQGRFSPAVFEFGRTRFFSGRIGEHPYPALIATDSSGSRRTYLLVAPGKRGAGALVAGRDGAVVTVAGTLIQRDEDLMLEITSGSIAVNSGQAAGGIPTPFRSRGPVSLVGEIVDGKCHLGVMKPGEGPTHRDCAVRCLLGGLPPMFVPHADPPQVGRMVVVTEDGGAQRSEDWARLAGVPVRARGVVLERDGQRFLAVSPDAVAPAFP